MSMRCHNIVHIRIAKVIATVAAVPPFKRNKRLGRKFDRQSPIWSALCALEKKHYHKKEDQSKGLDQQPLPMHWFDSKQYLYDNIELQQVGELLKELQYLANNCIKIQTAVDWLFILTPALLVSLFFEFTARIHMYYGGRLLHAFAASVFIAPQSV